MKKKLNKAVQICSKMAIPSIPEEVLKLKEELNKKYPNTVTIANLISHNPELLASFLSLVNSSLTENTTPIGDAKMAVSVMGLDEIYNLFLATSLTNAIAQTPTEKAILMHGAKAGLAAAELSYWVFDVTRSEAYMAGLMQNVGAVFLARQDPESYHQLFSKQLSNPLTAYKEEVIDYETSHSYLGTFLAKKWHMNSELYQAILMHHYADFASKVTNEKIRHLIGLMMAANYVVSSATGEMYITQELKDYRDLGLKELNLPANAMQAASAAVAKWGNSIGLSTGSH